MFDGATNVTRRWKSSESPQRSNDVANERDHGVFNNDSAQKPNVKSDSKAFVICPVADCAFKNKANWQRCCGCGIELQFALYSELSKLRETNNGGERRVPPQQGYMSPQGRVSEQLQSSTPFDNKNDDPSTLPKHKKPTLRLPHTHFTASPTLCLHHNGFPPTRC